MTKSTSQLKAGGRHYLKTGDHDPAFRGWPGLNFLDAAQRGSAMLCGALVAEVASRTQLHSIAPDLVNRDVTTPRAGTPWQFRLAKRKYFIYT